MSTPLMGLNQRLLLKDLLKENHQVIPRRFKDVNLKMSTMVKCKDSIMYDLELENVK
jgi:hypothetical protein